jgi:hypothetical protein
MNEVALVAYLSALIDLASKVAAILARAKNGQDATPEELATAADETRSLVSQAEALLPSNGGPTGPPR